MTLFKVGFTGTQTGMTRYQKQQVVFHLDRLAKTYQTLEIHHGDCIGADAEFHSISLKYWPNTLQVIVHPTYIRGKRAGCTSPNQTTLPVKPPLERNRDIVDAVDGMFAAPKESEEVLRSGTWAAVRYARKQQVPIIYLKREL